MTLTFGSLFAGIGGMDLGLEWAGMTCKWQVENDPYCIEILEKHWKNVRRYKDVKTTTDLPTVDLICGGFPCQPHSHAGARKGSEDSRDLWGEFYRIIQEVRPRWVVGENVPGIDTTILSSVCTDLENEGYSVAVLGITACSVGAPHIRERRFIMAHARRQPTRSQSAGLSKRDRSHSQEKGERSSARDRPTDSRKNVGYSQLDGFTSPDGKRKKIKPSEQERTEGQRQLKGANILSNATHSNSKRLQRELSEGHSQRRQKTRPAGLRYRTKRPDWWKVESSMGRVAHGVPRRVDRIRGLGNAVVPQVAEYIGNMIIAVDDV
jgi:DNA (cytosine-5)-methyltransferase 1